MCIETLKFKLIVVLLTLAVVLGGNLKASSNATLLLYHMHSAHRYFTIARTTIGFLLTIWGHYGLLVLFFDSIRGIIVYTFGMLLLTSVDVGTIVYHSRLIIHIDKSDNNNNNNNRVHDVGEHSAVHVFPLAMHDERMLNDGVDNNTNILASNLLHLSHEQQQQQQQMQNIPNKEYEKQKKIVNNDDDGNNNNNNNNNNNHDGDDGDHEWLRRTPIEIFVVGMLYIVQLLSALLALCLCKRLRIARKEEAAIQATRQRIDELRQISR